MDHLVIAVLLAVLTAICCATPPEEPSSRSAG
jgi:hypothetical protein